MAIPLSCADSGHVGNGELVSYDGYAATKLFDYE